ncbi:Transthyretin-like protein 15 [Toxocara canis]|uniref:Transthyretin-like protein 15 n=2 Tax=Toxocara canis TaxID=6265 RepID=A0A0B2VZ71_TOXCA|nr:Transthyretin-like protein 15 [Toxocara canis]VDM43412.1 unnamed protein product [Toxocara canis]
MIRAVLLTLLAGVCVSGLGSLKHVTITGQVACGTRAVRDAKVELWEHDTADPDDLLNTTTTVSKGNFEIYGQENEVGNIEPYLLITHSCDAGEINPKCTIVDRYTVPKEHIGGTYKMGIVSLNIAKSGRKKKCV